MNTIEPQTEVRTKALADALNASGICTTSNRVEVIAARNFSEERDFCVTFRDTVTMKELVHSGFPSRSAVWDSIELLGICERPPLSQEQQKLDSMSREERLAEKFPSLESMLNPPEMTTEQVRKSVPKEVLDNLIAVSRRLRQENHLAEHIEELKVDIAAGNRTVFLCNFGGCAPVNVKPLMLEIAEEVAAETESSA